MNTAETLKLFRKKMVANRWTQPDLRKNCQYSLIWNIWGSA